MVIAGPALVVLVLMLGLALSTEAQLVTNFYRSSCPNAENVITSAVNSAFNRRAAADAGVLRSHFHDCFVRGIKSNALASSVYRPRNNIILENFWRNSKTSQVKQLSGACQVMFKFPLELVNCTGQSFNRARST